MVMGSKFINVSEHASLVATWISGLMLPVIYSFCRCFGVPVPTDIPAEHTVIPASPAIQQVVDKMDDITNEAAKAVPDITKWLIGLTACKDLNDIQAYLEKVPAEVISNPDFAAVLNNMNKAVILKHFVPAENPLTVKPAALTPEDQAQLDSLK